jgi:hypothetical protein
MPVMNGCCCFDSLKAGSRASSFFTMITAILNIIIDIWALINLHKLDKSLEPHERIVYFAPGLLAFMYIELALNVVLFVVSFLLLVGINQSYSGKKLIQTWILSVIGCRSYEILLGIYILAWVGGYRVSDIVFVAPELIVVAAYWLLNTVILIAAILCVISYWQELQDEIHGKEHRTKYFTRMSNIRAASAHRRPGTATPSYSYAASRTMSHMSIPSQAQHSSAPAFRPPPGAYSGGAPPPGAYGGGYGGQQPGAYAGPPPGVGPHPGPGGFPHKY